MGEAACGMNDAGGEADPDAWPEAGMPGFQSVAHVHVMCLSAARVLLASGEPWTATAPFAASFLTAVAQAVHFADATQ